MPAQEPLAGQPDAQGTALPASRVWWRQRPRVLSAGVKLPLSARIAVLLAALTGLWLGGVLLLLICGGTAWGCAALLCRPGRTGLHVAAAIALPLVALALFVAAAIHAVSLLT